MLHRLVSLALSLLVLLLLFGISAHRVAADDLLLHWNFDAASEAIAKDLSGNELHGKVTATRVESPSGAALKMEGVPQSLVAVDLPQDQRLGKGSWTLMAMLKPHQFEIDSSQNQRRLFSYGHYPTANMVIDIRADGQLTSYFCYEDHSGKRHSVGSSSGVALQQNAWQHVAFVCDRDNQQIKTFVNGHAFSTDAIADGFDGDFSVSGVLTVGSQWQNYWGLVDEVKLFAAAVEPSAIEAEFQRLKETFAVIESPQVVQAKRNQRLSSSFGAVNAAWKEGDFDKVRQLCTAILQTSDAPAHFRSYAHLRLSQSYVATDDLETAIAQYQRIASELSYPAVHRQEANDRVAELVRRQQGLSARDPQATRTKMPTIASFAAERFVAVDGNDQGNGSRTQPFATLQRARDEVRTLKSNGVTGPIAVTMLSGEYPISRAFSLSSEDSGTNSAPVVYRAEQPGSVVLYGGKRLRGFTPVTDETVLQRLPAESRGKVLQCDLRALNVADFGRLQVRGFAQPPAPPTLELFVNARPMTLARWPNKGFVGIKKLIHAGEKSTDTPSVFQYDSDRHSRWTDAEDPWLFGYFHFLWADATIRVGKIDPETRTLTTDQPYHYGGRGMSTVQGIQYYAFNLLEEIDMPGEWYLDRKSGLLYLYPPDDFDGSVAEIGMLSTPMIKMQNVSHVRIQGLQLDLARYNGIELTDCNDCDIVGCSVSRFAGNGVMVHGGASNRLLGCDIHTIGRRGSEVTGGDRATLSVGGHLVENCRIYNFGRIDRTYTPAIQLEGVGHRVAHNLMYDGPSSAMRIEGNDHLIEMNEVHSMVQESDDQGAMELFGNPTYRGVVFRHNYFHQIGKTGDEAAVHGQAAIRFDDAISGMLVYGNLFYKTANGKFGAIQMNSGRDNIIDNNLFVDCKQAISGGWYPGNHVWKALRDGATQEDLSKDLSRMGANHSLYLDRYPLIATMLDEPGINHLWRNIFYDCGTVATRTANIDFFQNGVFDSPSQEPPQVNSENRDLQTSLDAKTFDSLGFKPIPLDEIGLYESTNRASWPVETTPVQMPDWR